jgi:hypothetical protein
MVPQAGKKFLADARWINARRIDVPGRMQVYFFLIWMQQKAPGRSIPGFSCIGARDEDYGFPENLKIYFVMQFICV